MAFLFSLFRYQPLRANDIKVYDDRLLDSQQGLCKYYFQFRNEESLRLLKQGVHQGN